MWKEPSTSQEDPLMVTTADSVYTNELNACYTAEMVQNELADTKDSNTCINLNGNADDQQPKSIEKGKTKTVDRPKRQRKSKYGSDTKAVQNESVEVKPKRSRVTKSKANPIKIEQPSFSLQLNDDVNGKCI